jgi:ABC-type Mn2+/Zn2+ transport system ATPase subunit
MDFARFDKVTLGYKRRAVLSHLSFSIYEGEFFGIVGGGRSGKTTLLRALLGILKPQSGEIVVHVRPGEAGAILPEGGYVDLSDTPGVMCFGYVPQRDSIDEVFPLTVRDIVVMGRQAALGPFRRPSAHDHDLVAQKLALVGLSEIIDQPYRALSSDQKQRVLVARALAAEARVMVLDEPVDGMSQENRRTMVKLFAEMHAQNGTTIIYATRRAEELCVAAQRILLLQAGSGRLELVEQVLGATGKTADRQRGDTMRPTKR